MIVAAKKRRPRQTVAGRIAYLEAMQEIRKDLVAKQIAKLHAVVADRQREIDNLRAGLAEAPATLRAV